MNPDSEKATASHTSHEGSSEQLAANATETRPYVVHFNPSDDKGDPRQWANWKRYAIVSYASWLNMCVCIGASGYSAGAVGIQKQFGVSNEVATVGLSLYVVRLLAST
jgi:hypothetical protein